MGVRNQGEKRLTYFAAHRESEHSAQLQSTRFHRLRGDTEPHEDGIFAFITALIAARGVTSCGDAPPPSGTA